MPFTLDTLEAFVSSAHYDSATAGLIASRIPELRAHKAAPGATKPGARPAAKPAPAAPAAKPAPSGKGQPGEHIAPGITRIHGNLCNVHGKYGPCDKALSGKKPKKGRAPAKPKQTPAQRAQAKQQQQEQNRKAVFSQLGLYEDATAALTSLRDGKPVSDDGGLVKMGLAEQASDGSYRLTPTGGAFMAAANAGDAGRARDTLSRGGDAQGKRTQQQTERTQRQQAGQTKREQATTARQERANAAAKKRQQAAAGKRGGSGDKKKPEAEKPLKVAPTKRVARSHAPSVGGVAGASGNKKPIKPEKPAKPEKAPAKQIAPALQVAAQSLSDGKQLSDDDTQALIRNGLARLVKGELVLTAAGMRATLKAFRVFKDASGADRWVAQSSTAFQDRDREIVSTKALADDVAFADETGSYGPLRWWHTPGLDLGDCDFNAMHGRILVESGTFRSPAIAQKVAQAAAGLEISLGFLHLPTEPDADGVFHHIRRFERSLVPRGKASNRFTAFTVKETRMFDPTKVAALKTLGFSDDDIAGLQAQAAATEKSATEQGVAYKADEPLPDVVINGVIYKAFKPIEEATDTVVEEDKADPMDAMAEEPMEEPSEGGLTLSPEDLAAINETITAALQGAVSQIMGGLDLEKKVAGHVQGFLAPMQQAQTTKDAEQAQTREQLTQLQQQVNELTGDQPARPYRATESAKSAIITDPRLLEAAQKAAGAGAGPFDDIIQGLGLSRPQ